MCNPFARLQKLKERLILLGQRSERPFKSANNCRCMSLHFGGPLPDSLLSRCRLRPAPIDILERILPWWRDQSRLPERTERLRQSEGMRAGEQNGPSFIGDWVCTKPGLQSCCAEG